MTPFHMSRTPFREPVASEDIGQSNDYVYGEILKKSPEEMEALKSAGVI